MSWPGVASGRPSAGERMLFDDSISSRASACASAESGRWTAIWSPSKSALNGGQTSGCTWIALPPPSTGPEARMPRRGGVRAPVVEERVDGLLQHPLLVVDDDLGRAEVEQPLEAVVPVDHPAVEVVEVARREAAAVELDHRAELRRDHRDRLEDHPLRLVLRGDEGADDLEPLDRALLLLTLRGLDRVAQGLRLRL